MRMFSEKAQKSTVMDTETKIEIKPKKASEEENQNFDQKFKSFFAKVAGDDGEIDSFELRDIVNEVHILL